MGLNNCSSEQLAFAGADFLLNELPRLYRIIRHFIAVPRAFVLLVANALSMTTFQAGYFRIFAISDRNIVSEQITKSDMMPAIKTKFPVPKILDNLS